ncbi:nitroreductase family protein [Nocardia huaxiensis]|uniref:Nitroreductase family protein n=1 Tax=Nocardia huaxiensis TaxID=2755382 RepID=A0A7D6VE77_9NOCA|nr:nitroreductase family protein [Nocardia huaxiensis]QLY33314.1 nitroreductase family protein [Nocardia huaxiensis]UFS99782.1 nitroreductase family protein [Nocardia huaxiensis]
MGIDLLTSTRAFRRRLDLTRPVSRQDLLECLDIAVHAPSGTNRQPWRFVVVQDPELKARIGEYYRKGFAAYLSARTPRPDQLADLSSGQYLADHMHEVPALVLVCSLGRPPTEPSALRLASFYGSIYPAVWNFLLALRDRGLGSTMTTAHLVYEREIAELLGIPFEEVTQVALLPVAHLLPGSDAPARKRTPAAEVTGFDGWPGAAGAAP